MTRAPFHASTLRPASRAGPLRKSQGGGKLVNVALLSLMRRVCKYVLRYPPLE